MAENEPSFGLLVGRRAWFAAWHFFESKLRDAVLFAGTLSAGGVAYYLLYGLPATEEQIVPVLIFTVGPIVTLWVALFIWHLWLAPSALAYEAASKAMNEKIPPEPAAKPVLPPRPPILPNWEIWKRRSTWTISEFAALLAGIDPAEGPTSRDTSSYTKLLLDHVNTARLAYVEEFSDRQNRIRRNIDQLTKIMKPIGMKWAKEQGFDVSHLE